MALKLIKPFLQELQNKMESAHLDKFRDASEMFECVICEDNGWVHLEPRGVKQCECLKAKQRRRLLDRIPPEYSGFDLADIQADATRHPGQLSLVPALQANPDMSILLCGRVG